MIEKIFFYKKNRFFLIGKEKKHLIPFELNEKKKKKNVKRNKKSWNFMEIRKTIFYTCKLCLSLSVKKKRGKK